ncbi:MAG: hypothetical protein OEM52_04335 [bacterium]|nr:hypothetical protein [bacterium]
MRDKRVDQAERGWLAQLYPLLQEHLGNVCDIHVVTLEPGVIRGNHFHLEADEAFFLVTGTAKMAWKEAGNCVVCETKAGEELVFYGRGTPHAIQNLTSSTIVGIAFSNRMFDESNPDRHLEILLSSSGLTN